jgi:hypothetical protein
MKESYKILLAAPKTVEKDEKLKHRPMIKITISSGYNSTQISSFATKLRKTANKYVSN